MSEPYGDPPQRFAFYGTLLETRCGVNGYTDTALLSGEFGPECVIPGQLWLTDSGLPGLVTVSDMRPNRQPLGWVRGRIWTPKPESAEIETDWLDHFEGFDPTDPTLGASLYLRRTLKVLVQGGEQPVDADVYIWNKHLGARAEVIESGDWLRHVAERRTDATSSDS